MSQPNASYGIAITGSDRTAAAAKSAERRLSQIPKRAGIANRRFAEDSDRTLRRHSRSIIRTFRDVEQAGARVFGGRSITSGISSRLGGVGAAASAAGTGLGEAAASGGVLSGVLGAVGVAAGATIGLLASAAYAALTVANTWAKGAASIGRTAAIIGVGTQALQAFTAAAERAGVDKGVANGTLGSLSQTLNDAKYGRNTAALSVLGRLGVGMQTNADGTVNVEGMLPQLADALKRQNSSGQRTAARALGIPIEALSAFTQGGAALSADMADAKKYANVLTEDQIATGERIARKGVIAGQLMDKAKSEGGAVAAATLEPAYDKSITFGRGIIDKGGSLGSVLNQMDQMLNPAAEKLEEAGEAITRGVDKIVQGITGSGRASDRRGTIGVTRDVVRAAQASQRRYGIPASVTLAQYGLESGFGRRMPAGSNNPFGIKARRGEPFVTARTREVSQSGRSYYINARFRKFGSLDEAFDAHARLLAHGRPYANARAQLPNVGRFADALTGTYATDPRYGKKLRSMIQQGGFEQYDRSQAIPVKVEIDMRGVPPGTRATATAGTRSPPAVSRAFQH